MKKSEIFLEKTSIKDLRYESQTYMANFDNNIVSFYLTVPNTRKVECVVVQIFFSSLKSERSGSVVECLTRDRRLASSSLTGGIVLCP